jgi:PAS domain S-box-containing protein
MVEDITDRKNAEEALRASEAQFRSVFREAGVGMVIVSPEGRYLAANSVFCDYLGYTEPELLEMTVQSITHPDDWPVFAAKLEEALVADRGFRWLQKRCLHKSGRIMFTESSMSVVRNREGDPQFFVAHVLDITLRKEAEEALTAFSRKLIEAQEQERARIGRELHDDINQRLALLAVQLDQLQENPTDVQRHLKDFREQTVELSNDVQALSHELHSSQLVEQLGVVAAMKSWCRAVSQRQRIEVTFSNDVSVALSMETSIALFRVMQEALHNAAKHSGGKRVEVRLEKHADEVRLVVSDSGKGFNVEEAMQGIGLGLTSMRERIRLVNGRLSIKSKPMHGTEIQVHVSPC